jgi:nicotinamidase-related amidase
LGDRRDGLRGVPETGKEIEIMHPRIAAREDAFLLIVDIQEPLLRVVREPERLLSNARILIEAARVLGLPILATEQYPERIGPTEPGLRERWGNVDPWGKLTFSACGGGEPARAVEAMERRTAIVCGVETHVCVNQTVHDLLAMGRTVHVPADAVTSRTELNWRLGLDKMRDSGAIVTTTETVVYEMMGAAGTPEFKALLPHLR